MKPINKISDWLWKNPWIPSTVLYLAFCVFIYLTARVEINGVALPQHDAGIIGLAVMHGMFLLAILGAWILKKIVELFGKIRKN